MITAEINTQLEKMAENYIDNMIADSDMTASDFYKAQAEFYKKHESHICDCFTDTSYAVKDISYEDKFELQSELESKIVMLVIERAEA